MLSIEPKTDLYNPEAKKALSLIKYRIAIITLPAVVLVVLGIALSVIINVYCLLVSLLGALYLPVMVAVLNKRFKSLNKSIKNKFIKYNRPLQSNNFVELVSDNRNYTAAVLAVANNMKVKVSVSDTAANAEKTHNKLYVWKDDYCMYFITTALLYIDGLQLKTVSYAQYKILLNKDFGKFCVPISDIEHYRENILVCVCGEEIARLTFSNNTAFDNLIPNKEYYYSTEKKNVTLAD